MSWVAVALSAYFLLAIANLLDKFLVDNVIKNSRAYAFIACLLGALVFLAAPWFLHWPGLGLFLFNILIGIIFALALWMLYESLRRGEASRVLVFIGGTTPVFSILFSILFFKETYSYSQWAGIIALLVGIFIIAFLPAKRSFLARVSLKLGLAGKAGSGGLLAALISALAYSLYFILSKQAYLSQPFFSAFIWTRLGAAFFVLFFLLKRSDRLAIRGLFRRSSPKRNQWLVVFNQGLGSAGFILQNYAIFLGSVALVNALQGAQYAFLLVISAGLAAIRPKLLKESFSWRIVLQKLVAVIVIGFGLYFITL